LLNVIFLTLTLALSSPVYLDVVELHIWVMRVTILLKAKLLIFKTFICNLFYGLFIFRTQFVSSFQMVKSAILFLAIQKPDRSFRPQYIVKAYWPLENRTSFPVFRCHLNTGPFDFMTSTIWKQN
jgi:hypothetical protein